MRKKEAFMNNGLLFTSNKEFGSKGFPHRKRNDLASDRTDDSNKNTEKFFVVKVLKISYEDEK